MKLIRETKNGKKITASRDPEILLAFLGDEELNTFGEYNSMTGSIVAYVLAISLSAASKRLRNEKEMESLFLKELTKVLAHEGGHWQAEKRYGKWLLLLDKKIIYFAVFAVVFLGIYFAFNSIAVALLTLFIQETALLSSTASVLSALATAWFMRGRDFLWRPFAWHLSYALCFHERYARSFARRAKQDRRWDKIITLRERDKNGEGGEG